MKEYPHNIVLRIGDGQSPSGKIIDRGTHWYNLSSYKEALQDAKDRHRIIYISINNRKYQQLTPEQLIKFAQEKLNHEN